MPQRFRSTIVFVGTLLFLGLLVQDEPYGDGISYLYFLRERNFLVPQILYLPDLWLFSRPLVWLGASEKVAAFWFSAACAAGGVAVLHRLLASSRKLAPGFAHPIAATLLVATTPLLVFFGTQVENAAHHFLWVCLTLLALDRALAAETVARWALAGIVLAATLASHSSVVLLVPALLVLAQQTRGATLRVPNRAQIARYALFLVPPLIVKLGQPWFMAEVLGGGDAYYMNFDLRFSLGILRLRSPSTWLDYLTHEFFLPAFGLWCFAPLVLRRGQRRAVAAACFAVLPYVLHFGHWNVRELGAYYLPVLPAFALVLARARWTRGAALAAPFLVAAQLGFAVHDARIWVARRVAPPWSWAADAARAARGHGHVLCAKGERMLHLRYDRGVDAYAVENQGVEIRALRANAPARLPLLRARVVEDFRGWLVAGDPVFVSSEAVSMLRADYPEFWKAIDAAFAREPVHEGLFAGYRLAPR